MSAYFHTVVARHTKAQATAKNLFNVLTTMTNLNLTSERDLKFSRLFARDLFVDGNTGTLPKFIEVRFKLKSEPQIVSELAIELANSTNDMVAQLPFVPNSPTGVDQLVCVNREQQPLELLEVSLWTTSAAGVTTAFTDYTTVAVVLGLE